MTKRIVTQRDQDFRNNVRDYGIRVKFVRISGANDVTLTPKIMHRQTDNLAHNDVAHTLKTTNQRC